MSESCAICGSNMNDMFSVKLPCGHEFHYECLYKTFMAVKKSSYKYRNNCPYCRKKTGLLPIVNGLTKAISGVHYEIGGVPPEIQNVRCQHILVKGKNKGNFCGKKCQLGYTTCKVHKSKCQECDVDKFDKEIDCDKQTNSPNGDPPVV